MSKEQTSTTPKPPEREAGGSLFGGMGIVRIEVPAWNVVLLDKREGRSDPCATEQTSATAKRDWPDNLGAIEGLGYLDGQRGLPADPPEDSEARYAYMQGYNGALEEATT